MKKSSLPVSETKTKTKRHELPDNDRKELQRQRNVANLRKNREKCKQEDIRDKEMFKKNEEKIERLEIMAEKLEREIRGSVGGSSRK